MRYGRLTSVSFRRAVKQSKTKSENCRKERMPLRRTSHRPVKKKFRPYSEGEHIEAKKNGGNNAGHCRLAFSGKLRRWIEPWERNVLQNVLPLRGKPTGRFETVSSKPSRSREERSQKTWWSRKTTRQPQTKQKTPEWKGSRIQHNRGGDARLKQASSKKLREETS